MARAAAPAATAPKRYEAIAEALIGEIRSGRLAVGALLPGEIELTTRFAASRHTVREALRRLEDLGLIERQQGVGTLVRARQPTPSYVQTVRSPAELLHYPADSRLVVVDSGVVKAGRKLARLLGCTVGSSWHRISCVRRLRDSRLPICWVDVYVAPEYAAVADQIGRKAQPVYEMIEQRFGERVGVVDIELIARSLEEPIATALGVPPGSPSLTVVRRYRGQGKRLFQATVSEHAGDRYTYSLQLKRGWQTDDTPGWTTG